MKPFLVALASIALVLASCYPAPGTAARTVDVPVEAGTEGDCQAACTALRAHHCPDGDPTPQGGTCEAVCLNTERSGYMTMNPRCVAKIQACSDEDACAGP